MNVALIKALVALLPACLLLAYSFGTLMKARTAGSSLQMVAAGCLVIVVFTHICEAMHLLPWMHWGEQHSVGHYVDLSTAILGVTLFPVGYLLHRWELSA